MDKHCIYAVTTLDPENKYAEPPTKVRISEPMTYESAQHIFGVLDALKRPPEARDLIADLQQAIKEAEAA